MSQGVQNVHVQTVATRRAASMVRERLPLLGQLPLLWARASFVESSLACSFVHEPFNCVDDALEVGIVLAQWLGRVLAWIRVVWAGRARCCMLVRHRRFQGGCEAASSASRVSLGLVVASTQLYCILLARVRILGSLSTRLVYFARPVASHHLRQV